MLLLLDCLFKNGRIEIFVPLSILKFGNYIIFSKI